MKTWNFHTDTGFAAKTVRWKNDTVVVEMEHVFDKARSFFAACSDMLEVVNVGENKSIPLGHGLIFDSKKIISLKSQVSVEVTREMSQCARVIECYESGNKALMLPSAYGCKVLLVERNGSLLGKMSTPEIAVDDFVLCKSSLITVESRYKQLFRQQQNVAYIEILLILRL